MDMYPLVLSQKVKRSLEGLCMIYLRWWKSKVVCGMFKWIGDKYRGFDRKQEGGTIGGGWTTGRIRLSRRGRRVKATKLEIELIALRDTLPRLQAVHWW